MTDITVVHGVRVDVGRRMRKPRRAGWYREDKVYVSDGRLIGTIRVTTRMGHGRQDALTIDTTGRAVAGSDIVWLLMRAKEEKLV